MSEVWIYIKAVSRRWWALLSCAAFTLFGVYCAYRVTRTSWYVKGSSALAGVMLLIACYFAWLDDYRKVKSLTEKPKLVTGILMAYWDVEGIGSFLYTYIYLHVRLTNHTNKETAITKYTLRIYGEGRGFVDYSHNPWLSADDWLERNDSYKTSSDVVKTDAVFTKLDPIQLVVTPDQPLKHGIHRDGWIAFRLPAIDPEETGKMPLDLEVIVTDSMGNQHLGGGRGWWPVKRLTGNTCLICLRSEDEI